MSRHRTVISVLFAFLCVSAFAQVKHVTVQIVSQTDKEITYRIVNESSQPLTSYTVGIDLTYFDGAVIRSEVSGEFSPSGPIAPGAVFEQLYPLGGSMHGKVSTLTSCHWSPSIRMEPPRPKIQPYSTGLPTIE